MQQSKIIILFLLCLLHTFIINAQTQHPTCYVSGRFLHATNGERILLRGVNKMNVATDKTGEKSFPEIAKTGANVVRIMWMKWGGGATALDTLIGNAIKYNLLPMIELHDATGKWGEALQGCVDFWVQADVLEIIKKYERYLLLNIANEAGDQSITQEDYRTTYHHIILQMRQAGIRVPLIIDAANWGRNEDYLLQNGQFLLQNDPLHNILFSWHIWDSGIAESRIKAGIDESIKLKIPLIIGEFAPMEVKCKCCIPYHYIMDYCQKKKIGWLTWSWGPGNNDCPGMDMSRGTFETLHGWGLETAVTHKNSIKNTAKRPRIF